MPFWRTFYHLIWSTREREHLITAGIEGRLFEYMVAKAAELGVQVYAINGWYDHVHLVVSIPPRHSVAEVVKRLKGASAHFVNQDLGPEHHFPWQRSYGVLTLGERQRAMAETYVLNQKQHHESRTAHPWLERCDDSDIGRDGGAMGARRESVIGEHRE